MTHAHQCEKRAGVRLGFIELSQDSETRAQEPETYMTPETNMSV